MKIKKESQPTRKDQTCTSKKYLMIIKQDESNKLKSPFVWFMEFLKMISGIWRKSKLNKLILGSEQEMIPFKITPPLKREILQWIAMMFICVNMILTNKIQCHYEFGMGIHEFGIFEDVHGRDDCKGADHTKYSLEKPKTMFLNEGKRSSSNQELKNARRAAFPKHFLDDPTIKILPNYFKNPSESDPNTVSICTQMHVSPITMARILDIASNWQGQVSVAVLLDNAATAKQDIEVISKFRSKNRDILKNKFEFHLVKNSMDTIQGYPHNLLRNVAINNAVTDYVMLLDVDFIPSKSTFDDIQKHIKSMEDMERKKLLVVPAFETDTKIPLTDKQVSLPATKNELITAINAIDTTYKPFRNKWYVFHGPTNYKKWYETEEQYSVNYGVNYEPYFVVHRSAHLPPLWEHFFGYGYNKISWVKELAMAGYKFDILPESFIVHINHSSHSGKPRTMTEHTLQEYYLIFHEYLRQRYASCYSRGKMERFELSKSVNWERYTFYLKRISKDFQFMALWPLLSCTTIVLLCYGVICYGKKWFPGRRL